MRFSLQRLVLGALSIPLPEGLVLEAEQLPETDPTTPPADPGKPDEPEQPPTEPNEPPPVVVVPSGPALDYFDRLKDHPAVHFADDLCKPNDPAWYGQHIRGGARDVHPYASYDADVDSMRLDLPDLSSKLGPGRGVDVYWPRLTEADGPVVIKYRLRLSRAIIINTKGKYKFVNILKDGNDIGIELRTHFETDGEGEPFSRFDVRSYLGGAESVDGRTIPIAGPSETSQYDRHPGPDSSWPYKGEPIGPPGQYVFWPDRTYVVTSEITWREGRIAYRQWLEDGIGSACLSHASPANSSLGFLLGREGVEISGIYFELDQSSGVETYTEPQPRRSVWFDRLIVLKGVRGEDVLGGRSITVKP